MFRDFINASLIVLGIVGVIILLYLVLRTFVQSQPPDAERRERRANRSSATWGDDTLDYFALRRDKNYYFSDDGRSLVAYVYVRGTAMVAGDPIGPPEDTAKTIDEFLAFCAGRGWRVAFFAVREADAAIYRDRGMHAIYLGDEAILRCREFHLDGRRDEGGRRAVRRIDRDHDFELISETDAESRAGRRAQRDQRRVAQGRARARVHDGARPGRRGHRARLRDRAGPRAQTGASAAFCGSCRCTATGPGTRST